MTVNDYKKRFIDLFKEMEKELGNCSEVRVESESKVACYGEMIDKYYSCRIEF